MSYDIFISYRHADSQQQAQALYDQLNAKFDGKVFLDKCSIPIGSSWAYALYDALKSGCVPPFTHLVTQPVAGLSLENPQRPRRGT